MSPCRVLLPGDRPIVTGQVTIHDQSQSSISCRAVLGSAGGAEAAQCSGAVPDRLGQGRKSTGGKGKRCCSHGSGIANDQEMKG